DVYDEIERAAREQLSELARNLRRRRVNVRAVLLAGTAPQAIVESAKKMHADLLVMATHGRSGLSHLLMGSVARRVLRTAPCPVLTIPGLPSPPIPRAAGPPHKKPLIWPHDRARGQQAVRHRPPDDDAARPHCRRRGRRCVVCGAIAEGRPGGRGGAVAPRG